MRSLNLGVVDHSVIRGTNQCDRNYLVTNRYVIISWTKAITSDELARHFCLGADVSRGHFGTSAKRSRSKVSVKRYKCSAFRNEMSWSRHTTSCEQKFMNTSNRTFPRGPLPITRLQWTKHNQQKTVNHSTLSVILHSRANSNKIKGYYCRFIPVSIIITTDNINPN